jgi:2-dehydropantoate 2-reductase
VRFVIYGAGGIGGTIGGRLYEAGADVTLVARGAHLDALRERGLTLVSGAGTPTLPVPAVGHPSEAGLVDGDVVILAMKAQGTAEAVAALAASAPPGICVACTQNGVENERVALRSFAEVYGVNVMLPALHLEPGEVVAHSWPVSGVLDIGRYPSGTDEVAEEMAATLSAATFSSRAVPDIMRWKYAKLLDNLLNAIDAVCGVLPWRGGAPPGEDAESAALAELVRRVRSEGRAVFDAAGVELATRDEVAERRAGRLDGPPLEGAPPKRSSTWQSLTTGRALETDFLTGEVVLLGRLHGVPTPANALLQGLARQLAADRRPPGAVPATEVLALLDG